MDLDWLRANPGNLGISLHHQRIRETPVPGGDVCTAARLTLDGGSELFVKRRAEVPADDFFAAEAAGLRWLTVPGGPPVPEVIAVDTGAIALQWIDHGEPTPAGAEDFGRRLATLHHASCERFGAPWRGYIATEPLDNTPPGADVTWLEWYRSRRIAPYLRASRDAGALTAADVTAVETALAAIDPPAEPPARIHGDLHPGNLLWGVERAWLVDPAAHGGHRETDLATLQLFGGTRYLDRIIAAYQEIYPLASGWEDRIGLHQLHLALVHTTLFGPGFAGLVRAAAGGPGRG
ncbi:fructosamine kinase family protein [Nocardia sp. NEAU-G5]|uniref:Fructosamine kinase family protein n=1 Tax=Nocardia albiluteola TaxID=2842303 RepID=A0ABS6B0S3_9NOCA|nr:fructosamine kinase family protein [Nocardia albiluteola]MBU3063904.1 fructosamine kinase family protein [Nocardia albiluteola]